MPLYDYQCIFCHKKTELLHKVSETPSTVCPHCRQDGLKKQVSAPQFKLKGTGWYETDFKTPKQSNPSDAASAEKNTDKTPTKKQESEKKEN